MADDLNAKKTKKFRGPGSSQKKAVTVPDVEAEYLFIRERFGDKAHVVTQELVISQERHYDLLTVALPDEGGQVELWFDITEYWAEHEKRLAEWRSDRAK